MIREKIRNGLDKTANWIRENKTICVAAGIVVTAIAKEAVKAALTKPTVVYYTIDVQDK